MNIEAKFADLEVGYDVPAIPGMSEEEIQTPCLILDLDALERNIRKMGDYAKRHNMRHRAHGKMHKSIKDVLVSNQVRDPAKIDRLARLPRYDTRIVVCIDDLANVAELSAAARKHGTTLECFVEIDCGAGRCGVNTAAEVVAIAKAIDAAPGLKLAGIRPIRAQCSTSRDTRTESSSSTPQSLRSRKRSKR